MSSNNCLPTDQGNNMSSSEVTPGDQHKIPGWVSETLNLDESQIAHFYLNSRQSSTDCTYGILLNFLAHRAVDIDAPSVPDSAANHADVIKSPKLAKNRREYPGNLTALSTMDITVNSMAKKFRPIPKYGREDEDEFAEPQYPTYTFGQGRAKLLHQGSLVCVSHMPAAKNDVRTVIRFYASTSEVLRSFIDSIFEWWFIREQPDRTHKAGKYELYTLSLIGSESNWKRNGWKTGRDLDTIFLPKGTMDEILADFQRFSSEGTKEWYVKHGLPHRRSYLFHGAAGTGKTSTIRGLAGQLKLAACFMELGDDKITNGHLTSALQRLPLPAMLVIEDVDAIFHRNRKTKNIRSPLTFSGLLNALDGLLSTDGVLTVMTTNHPELLDPALIRAGRIDRKFEFKKPEEEEFIAMFQSYYEDADLRLAKEFGEKVVGRHEKEAKSIATLTELFIYARESSARECIDKMDEFFEKFYPYQGNAKYDDALYS